MTTPEQYRYENEWRRPNSDLKPIYVEPDYDTIHPSHNVTAGGWCLNCDALVFGSFMGLTPTGAAPCKKDTSPEAAMAWLRG